MSPQWVYWRPAYPLLMLFSTESHSQLLHGSIV
ncbi:hypothetical protein NOR51B_2186 [Luminiphilus syltensis NOR5-1B]|uniref:Uncharacterized protein n=1 Tax=Luminiphilus syltensis NOR5-1B TaxID=565045 RepID=B8KVV7_9GAMM|nr:hypothetical protein NOR51B_2186 [Luminiphilus syltensis NOR5-1B]